MTILLFKCANTKIVLRIVQSKLKTSSTVEQIPTDVSPHISIRLTLRPLQTGCVANKKHQSADVCGRFIFASKLFRPGPRHNLASFQPRVRR